MPIPIATVGLVVSAVKSLIRLRSRVDSILSEKVATDALPFALPPRPPQGTGAQRDAVIAFYNSDAGRRIVEIADLAEALERYKSLDIPDEDDKLQLESIFLRFKETGEFDSKSVLARDAEQKLVTYVLVDSYRLSRNPAALRIALASADTLLEFVGENASTFVSNPKTARILETIIAEFAGRRDFDDAGADLIFRTLLGSAALAAVEHQGDLPQHPALLLLYGALGEVREKQGDEFVANIVSADGFDAVVSSYLTVAASDSAFLDMMAKFAGTTSLDAAERKVIRGAFTATLETIGDNPRRFLSDSSAFTGVLEAAIVGAASNAESLIRELADDEPLLAAVLEDVAKEIGKRDADQLFRSVANGELVGEIYKTALAAVAADPDLDRDGIASTVEKIVSGLADELGKQALSQVIEQVGERRGLPVVNALLARTFSVLATEPAVITGEDNAFAMAVVGAVLQGAAPLIRDGLEEDDVEEIVRIALHTASANTAALGIDSSLAAALSAFGTSIAGGGALRARLATRESRRAAFLAAIAAVAASPRVWAKFDETDLVKPVVEAVISGLRDDPTNVLTGSAMVEALDSVLGALAKRGFELAEDLQAEKAAGKNAQQIAASIVEGLVARSLEAAAGEIGRSIDRAEVPGFVRLVIWIALAEGKQALTQGIDGAIQIALTEYRSATR